MTNRICRRCNQEKPLDQFRYRDRVGEKFRWRRVCSKCKAIQHAEWRAKNKDKVPADGTARMYRWRQKQLTANHDAFRAKESAKVRAYNRKLKAEVYAAYGGPICACCRETTEQFLSIDHIHNDGYRMRKNSVHGSGYKILGWLKRNGFPKGFQILCMNCQHGKARNNGICPHQQKV